MAAVIERAAAVRAQSAGLRADAVRLRGELHRRRRHVGVVVGDAREICARVEARRAAGVRTAWSELSWELPARLLDDVLTVL